MAACAHDTNRRIELSTASLRKGLPDYYPATGLLERFFKAGVSITIGSDAHIASDICFGILEAQKHAFAAGVSNLRRTSSRRFMGKLEPLDAPSRRVVYFMRALSSPASSSMLTP